ncbi:MAG: hypothetical protein A2039_07480 [Candidatus Melainabacteria bacterium GWA2_34_9]|nr:MAG: hypothetical protein A2039_07480 [Candidatus Melainabacteria bacterium GWA2_34_9]
MGNFYCTKSHEYKDKDNEKAISYYLKAVDAFNTLIKIKPQYIMEISDIYNAIGSIYENGILYDKVHQSEKAKEYYLKAYKIKHKIMTNNPDEITVYEDQNLKNLTNINEKLKDYGEAEKNYLETIKRFENLLDKNTKDSSNVQIFEEYTILNSLAVANFELADFYLKVENYSGAQAYYFKTLNLSKIILNKSTYPRNGFHFNILNAIGEFYYKTQKFDKAENYYLMALDESYKIEGPTSFSATDSQKEIKNNLGDLYTKSGQIDKANRYYAEAKQL